MLIALTNIALGLLATMALGLGVRKLVEKSGESMALPPPNAALEQEWKRLVSGDEGGRILGYLERLVFFGAFWVQLETVIAAYLAFKVASKWNAWTNIVAVPKDITGLDPIEFLIARRSWGSHVLVTFLVGTLANIIAAYLGAQIGKYGIDFIREVLC